MTGHLCLARQSEDALSRSRRINELIESWRSALAGKPNPRAALQMIDLLGANPFLTPRGAEEKLGLAYNTVMRAIDRLQEQGILAATSAAKRARVFCAKALLDILEEPARLTPAEPGGTSGTGPLVRAQDGPQTGKICL